MASYVIPYRARYPEVHKAFESVRFAVLVAHRRFGKTVLAINHLLKQCLNCEKENPRYGYVAPYRTQAKAVAWDYLKHYSQVIPMRQVNESELSITLPAKKGMGRIRIFGADNPDSLRGMYFDGVIMDEVAQMKPEVWEETIQPSLADRKGTAVFIGTPKGINLFSRIYNHALMEQAKENPKWVALLYPCDKTKALDKEEIERLRAELSDNTFRQELLCDFNASSDDNLITMDIARDALNRKADRDLVREWPLVIGVDVARYGSDATVFVARQGRLCYEPLLLRGRSNTEVAHSLLAMINEHKPDIVNIDQGQGTGVIDLVRELASGSGCVINEVPFGSRAIDSERYVNRRSEMWKSLAEWLEGGALPKGKYDDLMLGDLTAPRYTWDSRGRMSLESKDEIKKRLGRSTDIGDALALTFAVKAPPKSRTPRPTSYKQRKSIC